MAALPEAPVLTSLSSLSGASRREAEAVGEDDDTPLPYGFGKFQLLIMLGTIVAGATFTLHDESFRLTAGVMDHWCQRPSKFANLSVVEWKELAIPRDVDGQYSRCTVREPPDAGDVARIVSCTSWEYDLATYGNNIVSEWNLVCDRRWIVDLARIAYSVSCMASLCVFGVAADRVGRRVVVFVAVPVVLVAGVGGGLPKDLHFFVAVRCLVSAAVSALVPPLLALAYEVSPMSKIPAYTVATWVITLLMVPPTLVVAQVVNGGWAVTQLLVMLPTALLLTLYYIIDESPAWLLVNGKVGEAERVATRAARLNGLRTGSGDLGGLQRYLQVQEVAPKEPAGPFLLCSKGLWQRTALLTFCWTALAYCYISFIFNDAIFVSVIVNVMDMLLTSCAAIAVARSIPRFGFKLLVVVSALICALASAVLAGIYTDGETVLRNSLVLLMRMAGNVTLMFFITLAINCYPVGLHCTALGTGLAFSRLGDTLAHTVPRFFQGRHAEGHLTVAAILMTLVAAATEFLPAKADWKMRRPPPRAKLTEITGEELRRELQASLAPLPKKRLRERRRSRGDKHRFSLDDQHSLHTMSRSTMRDF
ncbi:solute carrier family 22 member 6-like [Dermacentor albipictus]|uniref:solute carrier family 22 member 6-like n=1 Tax=Dermacentor albipictus TaxID=60249 RepID=UPI0038FC100E